MVGYRGPGTGNRQCSIKSLVLVKVSPARRLENLSRQKKKVEDSVVSRANKLSASRLPDHDHFAQVTFPWRQATIPNLAVGCHFH